MLKKTLMLLLATALLLTMALPAVAEEFYSPNTFPIVEEPIALKFATWTHAVNGDYDEVWVWNEYEKMTGIDIEWIQIPSESYAERRNIMFATNDLPDAFYKSAMPLSDVQRYASEGFIIPLTPMIEEGHAPSLTELFEKYPGVPKAVTLNDGNIYSLGYYNDCTGLIVSCRTFINRAWMDHLGIIDMPTTLDEYTDLLRTFRDEDANGNGDAADEIPLGGHSMNNILQSLYGAFGLGNRGSVHMNVDMGEDGNLRFIPTTDGYRDLMRYLNMLYTEKLLDQEMFTIAYETMIANASGNRYGSVMDSGMQFAGQYETDYEGVPAALIGPNGDQLYVSSNPVVLDGSCFVITSANPYPEETLRWIDYFYSEAGAAMLFLGERGVTFDTDESGVNDYQDWILNDPNGRTFDQMVGTFTTWGGGGNPVVLLDNIFIGGETRPVPLSAAKSVMPYLPEERWETFTYTDEEIEIRTGLANDIDGYIKETMAQFVTGKVSLDDGDWDRYVAEFEKMGLDEYMSIYEAAYVRYRDR